MQRLPAHLEIAALIRRTQAEGGFAAVLHKGEHDAGTLLLILVENGTNAKCYERMPAPDGSRSWHCSRQQDPADKQAFEQFIAGRIAQDRDLWVVELDVANPERLIASDPVQD